MFGIIALGFVCTGLMTSFVVLFVVKYKDDKLHGPLPHHPTYDIARQDRLMREEATKRNNQKTSVNIKYDKFV